jgi:hypothetical protein
MKPREPAPEDQLSLLLNGNTVADSKLSDAEIRALASLAHAIESLRPDALSAETQAALRIRVLNGATAARRVSARATWLWWRVPLVHARAAVAGAAAAVTLVVGSAGALSVSAASLPGDTLYGLKLARENVVLSLARSDASRASAYADQAADRIDEAKRLEGSASASAIEALSASAQRALDRSTALAAQSNAANDPVLLARLHVLEEERLGLAARETPPNRPAGTPGQESPTAVPVQVSRPAATPTAKVEPGARRTATSGEASPNSATGHQDASRDGKAGGHDQAATAQANKDQPSSGPAAPGQGNNDGNADSHDQATTARPNDGQASNDSATSVPGDGSENTQGHQGNAQRGQPDSTATRADNGYGYGNQPAPYHAPGGDQHQPTKTPSSGGHGKP